MRRLLSFIFLTVLLMPSAKAQEDLQKGAEPGGADEQGKPYYTKRCN